MFDFSGSSQMNRYIVPLLLLVCVITLMACMQSQQDTEMSMKNRAYTIDDIVSLFPKTPQEIETLTQKYISTLRADMQQLLAVPLEQRSFETVAQAFDRLCVLSDLSIFHNTISIIEMLHPDAEMREMAHKKSVEIQQFFVEEISNNKALYDLFKSYASDIAPQEELTQEQRYFVTETLKDFERAGLGLPDAERQVVVNIKKELAEISSMFDKNIAEDNRTITVTREGLVGVDEDFIGSLKQTDDGEYILGVDYPTYHAISENCDVEDTRKRLYEAFNNRAYPANEEVLKQVIKKRDELAQALGFGSYAYLDLDDQMVGSPERATTFLYDLLSRTRDKENAELDRLLSDMLQSVTLTEDGKIKPWDLAYIKTQYKKNHLAVDEQKLSEYFPMEKTIASLLDIYQQFFDLEFKEVPVSDMWHAEVKAIQVYRKGDTELLGTLFLDLYPRDNKYNHACHCTVVPTVRDVEGRDIPDISVVVANFPKSTATKPSLLKRDDVKTFFHEFGHAMHAILGKTAVASFSGTKVKRDFVELPSQMLEEWLWDKDILKMVSSHYQTGEPLSDELIANILNLKTFDSALFVQGQGRYGLLALQYYAPGAEKDPYKIKTELYARMAPRLYQDPNTHFYTSFGHLTGYGAKYYGYLWSKVFALDVFSEIKKHGLLNPEIGTRYAQQVLGKGGSKDPRALLIDFLGREPRMDAFIKDLGL